MQIIIETKNLELTESLKIFINGKMEALKKFTKILKEDNSSGENKKTLSKIFIEVEKETRHHRKGDVFRAEAIFLLPGRKLVARSHGEDLKRAIVEVKKELEIEIRKYKTKTIELPRRKYRKIKKEDIV